MVKICRKTKNAANNEYKSLDGSLLEVSIIKKHNSVNITITNSSILSFIYNLTIGFVFFMGLICIFNNLNIINTNSLSIVLLCIILFTYRFCYFIRTENLVILKGLGVQLTTTYLGGHKTRFLPAEKIESFFINEVIYQQKVVYVLTMMTRESKAPKLVPLFFIFQPRLNCLELIYQSIKKLG